MIETRKHDYVPRNEAQADCELVIDFRVQGMGRKAKPEGYDGAEIIWHIGDTPPAGPGKFTNHLMASRMPFNLRFEETQRAQKVWIALCWQNERGFRGAWSDYQSAIIP